jgi:hypothetical protein
VPRDEALSWLENHDPEAAESLGLTRGAADRLWALARAWLFR